MKRKILVIGVFILGGYFFFSPYQFQPDFQKRILIETTEIHAPIKQVFTYLGNSDNARNWSSFVSHIIPLNPKKVADGAVGSIRRCFKNPDENGEQWDEEILIVEPNQRRRLSIFNLKNFQIGSEFLLTEQLYERLGAKRCRLTFTLFLKEEAGWIEHLKMYYASYQISRIFKKNIQNIKTINERKYRQALLSAG